MPYNSHDENKAARYRQDTTSLADLNVRRRPLQAPIEGLEVIHLCFFCPEGQKTRVNGSYLEENRLVYVDTGVVGNQEPILNAVCRPCAEIPELRVLFEVPLEDRPHDRSPRPKRI